MRAYQDMVFSTAARLTANDAQAEDIVQEVFLKAYEHFDQLRAGGSPGGWLKTVTTNLTLNFITRYRKRWRFFSELRRADEEDDGPEIEVEVPDSALDELSATEREQHIETALKRLPEHQRVPLVLFHFEDMPYDEIAQQLGVSLSKVKTDILRGRAAMAKSLERVGVTTALA